MKTVKMPKKRNLGLHIVLISKSTSGAGGRHAHIKSKSRIKKILTQLIKKDYYD